MLKLACSICSSRSVYFLHLEWVNCFISDYPPKAAGLHSITPHHVIYPYRRNGNMQILIESNPAPIDAPKLFVQWHKSSIKISAGLSEEAKLAFSHSGVHHNKEQTPLRVMMRLCSLLKWIPSWIICPLRYTIVSMQWKVTDLPL